MANLEGIVSRIVFRNETNWFTVMKVDTQADEGEISVVGCMPGVGVGENLQMQGDWGSHPSYGKQFKVTSFNTAAPATVKGIERYLASGAVRGIGPATAKAIVDAFKEDTFDVLENDSKRLREIPGIGEKKAAMITESFDKQKDIRLVMVYLQERGVTPAFAARIYRHYGDATIEVIQDDPYRLADDVLGIGFKSADRIAVANGIAADSRRRIMAGLRYVLSELTSIGNVFIPVAELFDKAAVVLDAALAQFPEAMDDLVQAGMAVTDEIELHPGEMTPIVYLTPLFMAERNVAARLAVMTCVQERIQGDELEAEISRVEQQTGLKLAEKQALAVKKAIDSGMLVITGGPGTGKTTTINTLISVLEKEGLKIMLAAPTGRAAKRMTEATGHEAKTLHRLLEYAPGDGGGRMQFGRDDKRPLETDVLIVDEASMIDILLMNSLLKALRPGTRLIFVGDKDQLPSVGPGSVLRDIIASEVIDVVELDQIFRQAGESMIIVNAHKINKGEFPQLGHGRDFYFIEEEDLTKILDIIRKLVCVDLPKRSGLSARRDIQVLSPMRKTLIGVENLNQALQSDLNPPKPGTYELKTGTGVFRVGDRIMQMRNNYMKGVFNGDIGIITDIDKEDSIVLINFPDSGGSTMVPYDFGEMEECSLAYATSVHKSQGSEYPIVVMPVSTSHYMLLQRNLLYTGVTRAKKMVVLVGTKKAIAMAVRNNKESRRYTKLAQRLRLEMSNVDNQ